MQHFYMYMSMLANLCCMMFLILLIIIYYKKKSIDNTENYIYKRMLNSNLFFLIVEITLFSLCIFCSKYMSLILTVEKLYLYCSLECILIFIYYIYTISNSKYKNIENNIKLYKKFNILRIVAAILIFVLPITHHMVNGFIEYSYGAAPTFMALCSVVSIMFGFYTVIKNRKSLDKKKVFPLYVFVISQSIFFTIHYFQQSLFLSSLSITLISYLMYFTIENPDIKLLSEVYKNKELIEQSYEDKSNFLFELTQQVRTPIMNLSKQCKSLENINNIKELKNGIKELNNSIRQLDFVVNDVLDVSTLEAQKVKFVENRYNVNNLYTELVSKIQPMIPENVEFITTSTKNVPYLYGDSIKLKQVLYSILLNAVKKTEKGFIEFHIDTIERYDVCRLLFSIKDSGCGISIDKINEILAVTGEINQDDIKAMEKTEINMELCQKIVKLFGGNLMIKSNLEKGTEVILSIDQKVVLDNKDTMLEKTEYYIKFNKKVLIVSQNKELISNIKDKLNSKDISYSTMFYGRDAIDKIKSGKMYDYILMDDDMNEMNGFTTLKELNKIKDFNIPVIIMLKDNKEQIKEHYIEDGFKDYLLIKDFPNEINRIIDKY